MTDQLSVAWQDQLRQQQGQLPWEFSRDFCSFVFAQGSLSQEASYPTTGPSGQWTSTLVSSFAPLPPTVASRLGLLRRAAKRAFGILGIGHFVVSVLDRTDVGVGFRLDGIVMGRD